MLTLGAVLDKYITAPEYREAAPSALDPYLPYLVASVVFLAIALGTAALIGSFRKKA